MTTAQADKPTKGLIPETFRGTSWESVEPLLKGLLTRAVGSRAELEQWLVDRSEVESAIDETETLLYINMTCDTESEQHKNAYLGYVETIPPRLRPMTFELNKRQVELTAKFGLDDGRYAVISRDIKADVDLFRHENVPLQTELDKAEQHFQSISGAMTVQFDGREQTLPQMQKYQESTDRRVRESAWRAVAARRMKDRDSLDELYDKMVWLRDRVARNAGFADYVGYAFRAKRRFDYTAAHCRAFHDAVERAVVPMVRRLDAQRRRSLGLESAGEALRPWDLSVDVKGRAPLRPFTDAVDLMRKGVRTFRLLDPRLGEMLASMGDGSNDKGVTTGASLDLASRKGKAPGGYQSFRERTRKPFIFMNAVGLQRDMETLLHEAGHAFHSMVCAQEPLRHYRGSPLEFAEVASMSMELLTMPHWSGSGGFYESEADWARARRKQIEGSVGGLAWIATIDAFQHWAYGVPRHTRAERTASWLGLEDRFGHELSWAGLEQERATVWHRQLHLFTVPFYYIEYGIAQLGALQLWVKSLEQGSPATIEAYLKGLRLGGSKPLPELFAAAGLPFDFGYDTVRRLVDRAEAELSKLPE